MTFGNRTRSRHISFEFDPILQVEMSYDVNKIMSWATFNLPTTQLKVLNTFLMFGNMPDACQHLNMAYNTFKANFRFAILKIREVFCASKTYC